MQSRPVPTKLGFRRDVKIFVSLLVGYLIVIILTLLLTLQLTMQEYERSVRQEWDRSADAIARGVEGALAHANGKSLTEELFGLRAHHRAEGVRVRFPNGRSETSGLIGADYETVIRPAGNASVISAFDASRLNAHRRRFRSVAAIAFGSTMIGSVLLILFLPKIVKPIEDLLDQASVLGEPPQNQDETRYLIETFKMSLATMKAQEEELRRLHGLQKRRADDLERVSVTLTRSLTSGFLALDPQGRLVDMNAAAEEILRLPPGTRIQGTPIAEVLGDTPFVTRLFQSMSEQSVMSRVETMHTSGGATTMIGLTAVPLFSDSAEFIGTIALFTDLTPFRRLEARLAEVQTLASLGEIAAGIAHEFRNSLSTILGYIKLAGREQIPDSVATRLRAAEQEAHGLTSAVEGLMNFARPYELDWQPVDVHALVLHAVDRLRDAHPEIDVAVDAEALDIRGDASLLLRAIENVLRNAVEAVEEAGRKGRIDVRLIASSRTLVIADNGIGLDRAAAARLFLPFQSGKARGFGLGLALTKKIILLHGGSVTLEGEPGVGATVTMELAAAGGESER